MESPKWSIITLTIKGRETSLKLLKDEVSRQIGNLPIEHLVHQGPNHYGTEMRASLEKSKGEYVSYVDDDDMIETNYVSSIYDALQSNPDVVTFGLYTPGNPPCWQRTNISDGYRTTELGDISKTANHICCWKRELALSSPWLPRSYGAELIWYTTINLANPNLNEVHIHEPLYIYQRSGIRSSCQNPEAIDHALRDGGNRILCFRHKETGQLFAGKDIFHLQGSNGERTLIDTKNLSLLREVVFR